VLINRDAPYRYTDFVGSREHSVSLIFSFLSGDSNKEVPWIWHDKIPEGPYECLGCPGTKLLQNILRKFSFSSLLKQVTTNIRGYFICAIIFLTYLLFHKDVFSSSNSAT
jgi:hypothetical protein